MLTVFKNQKYLSFLSLLLAIWMVTSGTFTLLVGDLGSAYSHEKSYTSPCQQRQIENQSTKRLILQSCENSTQVYQEAINSFHYAVLFFAVITSFCFMMSLPEKLITYEIYKPPKFILSF